MCTFVPAGLTNGILLVDRLLHESVYGIIVCESVRSNECFSLCVFVSGCVSRCQFQCAMGAHMRVQVHPVGGNFESDIPSGSTCLSVFHTFGFVLRNPNCVGRLSLPWFSDSFIGGLKISVLYLYI